MLRWRKEAHAIGPRERQLTRDGQPDGIRKLKKRGQSERIEISKFARGRPVKICKPIGTDRDVDYDTCSSSDLMLFTSSLMFGCCTLANR